MSKKTISMFLCVVLIATVFAVAVFANVNAGEPNHPPVADAGPDMIKLVNHTVQFDGSQSYDIDGYIVAYDWDFGDGSPHGSGVTTNHTYNETGIYMVTLTVTDNEDATGNDTAVMYISNSIQDIIDAANPGDTVNVPTDHYWERIIIDKPLTLIGEDKNTTIIDGVGLYGDEGPTVRRTANDITIRGFTIINGTYGVDARGHGYSHLTITDNIITSNKYHGIYLSSPSNNISKNLITANGNTGIYIAHSYAKWNTINDNTISNQNRGIQFWYSATNNKINNNNISDNSLGLYMCGGTDNLITNNTIKNNQGFGICIDDFISTATNNNIIRFNTIEANDKGVYILGGFQGLYATGNKIYLNNFINNTYGQAYDTGYDNRWDTGHEGNYWSDYTGMDLDNNGIGDTPYQVDDDTWDHFPYMTRDGWLGVSHSPVANAELDMIRYVGHIVQFDGSDSYDVDGYIVAYDWDFGDGSPHGSGVTTNHIYNTSGIYTVKLTVTDNDNLTCNDTATMYISNSIQDMIDAASPSDTVYVPADHYWERIIINKPLTLIGEDKNTTIINGLGLYGDEGPTVRRTANDITIQGFTIMNGTYGIDATGGSTTNLTITDNIITSNKYHGIYLSSPSNNISKNLITANDNTGIYIAHSYAKWNTINDNTISNQNRGIQLMYSATNNKINNNNISDNSGGFYMNGGCDNLLTNNTIKNNQYYGICIDDFFSIATNNNIIRFNTIEANDKGVYIYGGFQGLYATGNKIYLNNFINNTYGQAYDTGYDNRWDTGHEGNYWSDYTGEDLNSDGIGDTNVPHLGLDNYPLIYPFQLTRVGTNVSVYPGQGFTVKFSNISHQGNTYADLVEGSPPAKFQLVPSKTFYEITTTATYEGIINISISYNESDINGWQPGPVGEKKEKNLKLKYFDENISDWIGITTWVDIVNNVIYGETSHLTIYAAMLEINEPPEANAGGPYEVDENTEITFDASSSSDPNNDKLFYRWDFDNDGTWDTDYSTDPTATHTWNDDYSGTVKVEVFDVEEADTATATVTVNNVAPTITSISAPMDPIIVNSIISVSGTFTDPGPVDTHTATWDWDDGNESEGSIEDGMVSGSYTYTKAGVYTITLTVTDNNNGVGSSVFRYVVIYDPEGGFVTGGGWIDSPAGAYKADPELEGKANFGFVSKYKKGSSEPTGNTEFQFKAGDLNFHSDSYDWLVIAGARAIFKGTGTINGRGDYKFKLWAVDGELPGGGGVDKFRIKIWQEDSEGNELVVYDNGAETPLGGGQIVIHKGK